jgi:hypothetical protein
MDCPLPYTLKVFFFLVIAHTLSFADVLPQALHFALFPSSRYSFFLWLFSYCFQRLSGTCCGRVLSHARCGADVAAVTFRMSSLWAL